MREPRNTQAIRKKLRPECEKCFGLCCVALPFSDSEDFAFNKQAGKPCPNLRSDFHCRIHSGLREKGFKGCTAFECFGAGQKVSQVTFHGVDWRVRAEVASKMFTVFPKMIMLHELLWYLQMALSCIAPRSIHSELSQALNEIEQLTQLSADSIIDLDLQSQHEKLNDLFLRTSELVWQETQRHDVPGRGKRKNYRGADLIGKKLNDADLVGANFRGAYLIAADLSETDLTAADFIGADLRDTNLRGADLTGSIFLTQAQLNSAKGSASTKLPSMFNRPSHWQ
ncbi:pentapeptide repeat-containing protein [Sporolactobacillus shoreicorticis]|uniref:Pentapeptide repeat-containing protein n=1 Tax=Sporolactobacillus shoreicorticis TaxID=1923877 RepID=A0ABW5S1W8_9BACL|nr:pentapeptide repeat-containing protein [Sporolactobacillus shoreicorticis]MCO7125392.1 pentapeptide repeat-containing protein [Sporolactobacillus shoreicorticis]